MKKILFTAILASLILANGFSQAVLPASWSFTTPTLPIGWTESGTGFYTASGNTPPAMRLDSSGDFLLIEISSNPGALSYYLTGNGFAGGTFSVEESALGTVFTTLRTHTALPNGSYSLFTDNPLPTTRFIRFIYTVKASGNVGLDDVSILQGAATPEQEINIKQGTTTVLSGGTFTTSSSVGTATPTTFTVENLGTTDALTISAATLSGSAASDFSVTSFPTTVAASSTQSLVVSFNPTANGTRNAILTIVNNDNDEPNYVINLNGIGGGLATEPTSQPTALAFSNLKTFGFNGNFTAAPGVDGYLVLRKKGSAITGTPVDGVVYKRGDIIGDAQVVYSSSSTSFRPNNINASGDYHFAVFAYNGISTFRNYRTNTPLVANVSTPATMQPASYYNGISTTSSTFVADLHSLINPHQVQFYSNYGILMVAGFATRDTVDDQRVLTCVYSGENRVYSEPFDFTATGYSREHTFPHSWMPTNPAQNLPEYSDYHHLFPTNQNGANSVRSNYPLGEVATVQSTFLGAKYGTDASGRLVYEPRDEHKGDAARAMMYQTTCYTTVSGNLWSLPSYISFAVPYGQDQAILKKWHFEDLPNSWEITRNDYIDSLQNNRNPYIDSVDFACYVNFSNMSYEPLACLLNIEEILSENFYVYPNPAKDILNFHVDGTTISHIEILDFQGRIVRTVAANGVTLAKLDVSDLASGMYTVKVATPFGNAQKTIILE